MRRSRGLILVCTVVVLHLLVFSILRYHPHTSETFRKFDLFDVKNALLKAYPSNPSFYRKIAAKFAKKYHSDNHELTTLEQNQMFELNLGNNENFNQIVLPEYMVDPDSSENPHFHHFDPRFTIGLVLHWAAKEVALKKEQPIALPFFHWADYVDMSALEQYYFSPNKRNCRSMFDVTTSNPSRNKVMEFKDPKSYCFDDDEVDALIEACKADLEFPGVTEFLHNLKVIKNSPYSTGFHIFSNCGRGKKAMKPTQAKSYLNDFMPPPSTINFLLPYNNIFTLDVAQDITMSKKRLHDSHMLRGFLSDYALKYRDELEVSKDYILDTKETIFELTNILKEQKDNKEFDDYGSTLPYHKNLTHEMFVDRSADIKRELEANVASLNHTDRRYFKALEYSLSTPSPVKHFAEAKILKREPNWGLGGHYDWRFFDGLINYTEKQPPALYGLLRAWLKFTNSNDLTTWVAHGSLLSWYWNALSFPWDNDIDVQMPIEDLHKLARRFNQSIIVDLGDDPLNNEIRYGRYFIDCGSSISNRNRGNGLNNIDARLIDMDSGLYIDITGLALTQTRTHPRYDARLADGFERGGSKTDWERNEYLQVYNCRNNHFSRLSELSPLKLSMVQGEYAYVPNDFQQALRNEYGNTGLTSISYKGYTFLPKLKIWLQSRDISNFIKNNHLKASYEDPNVAPNPTVIPVAQLTDSDYIKLVFDRTEILVEYLLTANVTELHEREIKQLIETGDARSVFYDQYNQLIHSPNPIRHDFFTQVSRQSNYEYEKRIAFTSERVAQYHHLVDRKKEEEEIRQNAKLASPLDPPPPPPPEKEEVKTKPELVEFQAGPGTQEPGSPNAEGPPPGSPHG